MNRSRVSTNDQHTIPLQIRALREYAAGRGWTVSMQVRDIGFRSSVPLCAASSQPIPPRNRSVPLIRFGRWTIYHAGDCAMYDGLVERLRPFNVSVALLPISGNNFSVSGAAQLAADIGANWMAPMHYGTFGEDAGEESHFVSHMLGQRPEQAFKLFQCGEIWTVPEE